MIDNWYRLPCDLPMPEGLTPIGETMFWALQNYGVIFDDRPSGDDPNPDLAGIPWAELVIVTAPE